MTKRRKQKQTSLNLVIVLLSVILTITATFVLKTRDSDVIMQADKSQLEAFVPTAAWEQIQLGDIINYNPYISDTGASVPASQLTYTSPKGSPVESGNGYAEQVFDARKNRGVSHQYLKWKVFEKDPVTGHIKIVPVDEVLHSSMPSGGPDGTNSNIAAGEPIFYGGVGYLYLEQEIHNACRIFGYGKGADKTLTYDYYIGGPFDNPSGDQRGIKKTMPSGSGARSLTIEDANKLAGITTDKAEALASGGALQYIGDNTDSTSNKDYGRTDILTTPVYYPTMYYVSPKINRTATIKWVGGPSSKPSLSLRVYQTTDPNNMQQKLLETRTVTSGTATTKTETFSLDETTDKGIIYGYSFDLASTPANYTKSISGDTITLTYNSPKITFSKNVNWVNGPTTKPTVPISLYRNGVKMTGMDRNTPAPSNNISSVSWTGLDQNDSNGVAYTYTIQADSAVTQSVGGYTATYAKTKDANGDIRLTYQVPTRSYSYSYKVSDGPTPYPTVTLQLTRNGSVVTGQNKTAQNNATHTWTNLPATDSNGNVYNYGVSLLSIPENYTFTTTEGLKYVIPKVNIDISKTWQDGQDIIPNAIDIRLYRNKGTAGQAITTHTITKASGWKLTIANQDETDINGVKHIYEVEEITEIEGFTPSVTGDGKLFTITNIYTSPKTSRTAEVRWVGGGAKPNVDIAIRRGTTEVETKTATSTAATLTYSVDKTDTRGNPYTYNFIAKNVPANYTASVAGNIITLTYTSPKIPSFDKKVIWSGGPSYKPSVTVSLYRNGIKMTSQDKVATSPVANVGTVNWTNLEKTDANGNVYNYTVKIDTSVTQKVGEYTATYAQTTDANGDIRLTYQIPNRSYTYNYKVNDGPIPGPQVTLQLTRNGSPVSGQTKVAQNAGDYTWTNLPATDSNGNIYNYSVSLTQVPDNYTFDPETGIQYIIPLVDIEVSKAWKDGEDIVPDSVNIKLYKNRGTASEEVTTHTITKASGWKLIIKDQEQTDIKGVKHDYDVEETTVIEGFTPSIAEGENYFTITNTYTSPKVNKQATVKWIGGGQTPNVDIVIKDGTKEVQTKTVTSAMPTVTFNVDKATSRGKDITYTFGAKNVPTNYTASVAGNVITLTYKSPQIPSFDKKVIWSGGPSIRPNVTVSLYRDGVKLTGLDKVASTPVSDVGTVNWANLDQTDANGKVYNYTVNIDSNVTQDLGQGIIGTYTKSITADGDIKLTYKIPTRNMTFDYTAPDVINPPQVKVELYEDGVVNTAQTKTVTNSGTLTWTNLPATDANGRVIEYTIKIDANSVTEPYKIDPENPEQVIYVIPKIPFTQNVIWEGGPTQKPAVTVSLYRNGSKVVGLDKTLDTQTNSVTWTDLDKTTTRAENYTYTGRVDHNVENYSKSILENGDIKFTYVIPKTSFTYNYVVENGPAEKPEVTLTLLRDGIEQSGKDKVVKETGNYTWDNLDKTDFNGKEYVYDVVVKNPPENYIWEPGQNDEPGKLVYVIPKINIVVNKNWKDGATAVPESIDIKLYRDRGTTEEVVTEHNITKASGWTLTIENQNETDINGKTHVYEVEETTVIEGFNPTIISGNNLFTITNTYKSIKIDKSATVKWQGGGQTPNVDVVIKDGTREVETKTVTSAEPTVTFNVDKTDSTAKIINYTFATKNVPTNYKASVVGNVITLTYNSPKLPSFDKQIIWEGGPTEKPPVTVSLYRNGSKQSNQDKIAPAPVGGIAKVNWTGLDENDFDGQTYTYTINVDQTVTQDMGNGITATYAKTITPEGDVKLTYQIPTKTIEYNYVEPDVTTPPEVTLDLYKDGQKVPNQSKTITNTGTLTWPDLPATDENGKIINYDIRIDESKLPEGYTVNTEPSPPAPSISYSTTTRGFTQRIIWNGGPKEKPAVTVSLYRNGVKQSGKDVLVDKTTNTAVWTELDKTDELAVNYVYTGRVEHTVTNYTQETLENGDIRFTYTIPKTSFTYNYETEGGEDLPKPEVTLKLTQNGVEQPGQEKVVTQTGEYTWDNLDDTDFNGNPHVYDVVPQVPEPWKVINGKIVYESPRINIEISKTWVDGQNIVPDTIDIKLYRNKGTAEEVVTTHTIRKDAGWNITVENLEETNPKGTKYIYEVEEITDIEGFTPTVEQGQNLFKITNTYTSPKIDKTASVNWVGGASNPSVTVAIMDGDKTVDTKVATDTSRTVRFNVDKADSTATDIDYRFELVTVPENYRVNIVESIITLTYVSPKTEFTGNVQYVEGESLWKDVTVNLNRDGNIFGQPVQISADEMKAANGNASFTVKELDLTDQAGKEYKYTITVASTHPEFGITSNPAGDTITLTYNQKLQDQIVNLNWTGGNLIAPTAKVNLLKGEEVIDTKTVPYGTANVTFENYPITELTGEEIDYRVQVEPIENFVISPPVKTTNLHNVDLTYKSEKITFTYNLVINGGPTPKPAVNVKLLRDGVEMKDELKENQNEGVITWINLDKTDNDGKPYVYKAQIELPENYVINPETGEIDYVSPKFDITIQGKWVDGEKVRPTEMIVTLKRNGVQQEQVTLKAETWAETIRDLDVTDENGQEYVYTIEDARPDENFNGSIEGFVITKTYSIPRAQDTARIVWDSEIDRPNEVTIQAVDNNGVVQAEAIATLENDYTVTYEVPATDRQGNNLIYELSIVEELPNHKITVVGNTITANYIIPETEFTGTVKYVGGNAFWTDVEIELLKNDKPTGATRIITKEMFNEALGNVEVTYPKLNTVELDGTKNTYGLKLNTVVNKFTTDINEIKDVITLTFSQGQKEIKGNIVWDGGQNTGETIKAILKNGTEVLAEEEIAIGQTEVSFTGREIYANDGTEIPYTLEFEIPETFNAEVVQESKKEAEEVYTVTFTYEIPKTNFEATKIWQKGPVEKPDVVFELYKDNVKVEGSEKQVDKNTNKVLWTNLDLTDKQGTKHTYYVREVGTLPGYAREYLDEKTVQNTYIVNYITETFEVTYENGPKPNIDEVILYQNDVELRTVKNVNEGIIEFENLPDRSLDGKMYTYTLGVRTLPTNYEIVPTENVNQLKLNYVIPKITFTIEKAWEDGDTLVPEEIEVMLYRNEEEYKTVTVTKENNWTIELEEDQTDINGDNYTYSVKEITEIEGFTNTVENFKITNKYVSPELTLTAYKVWVDGSRREQVTLVVKNDANEIVAKAKTEGEDFKATFTVPRTDEKGNEINYIFDEEDTFENYTKIVSGNVIINRYSSPKTDIIREIKVPGEDEGPGTGIEVELIRTTPDGKEEKVGETKVITKEDLDKARKEGKTYIEIIYKDVDKTDKDGNEYRYEIKAGPTSKNYEAIDDGTTIVIKYVPPKGDIVIPVDYPVNPHDPNQPTITVKIIRKDKDGKETVIGEERVRPGQTEIIVKDQALTDENGNPYEYIARPLDKDSKKEYGYVVTADENGTIVVKYIPKKIDITAEVIWQGLTGNAPTVRIQLYRNGVKVGEPVTIKNGTRKHIFKDLNETDKYGRPYTYKVDQLETPKGFTKTLKEDKYQIINTKQEVKGEVLPFAGNNEKEIMFAVLVGFSLVIAESYRRYKSVRKIKKNDYTFS